MRLVASLVGERVELEVLGRDLNSRRFKKPMCVTEKEVSCVSSVESAGVCLAGQSP